MAMRAKDLIGDNELAVAVKFAELAVRAMGPVRLAASGLHTRVDGAGADDDAQAARDIHLRREWEAACAVLDRDEKYVLLEILYHERTVGDVAKAMFGGVWKTPQNRNGYTMGLIARGLKALVRHWITKGG